MTSKLFYTACASTPSSFCPSLQGLRPPSSPSLLRPLPMRHALLERPLHLHTCTKRVHVRKQTQIHAMHTCSYLPARIRACAYALA
jgi:hypothetical protein